MKEEARNRLKQILGAYDAKLAETERVEAARRAAKAAFPERFAALKKDLLLPVLQELADEMNGSGHEAEVHQQEESSSTAGGVTSAGVWLRVIPKAFAQNPGDAKKSFVQVTFSANRSERKVVVSSTTTLIKSGGSVGKRGEYEIELLTADVAVDHVLRTLEAAFAGE